MANEKKVKLKGFEFKPFSKKQLKVLSWAMKGSPTEDKYMLIADGAIRSGKEQPIDAKIYTPTGYKLMGDIQVGDYVLDRLGNPTKVLGVFPQGIKDVYKITFHDGSYTECGKEHLWSYTTRKCAHKEKPTLYTSTLSDIMHDLNKFHDRPYMYQRAGKYRFPLAKEVNFNSQDVKIDAYLLGLLLGDGCFSRHNSEITFINDEMELHDYVEKIMPQYSMRHYFTPRKNNHCAYARLGNKMVYSGKKTVLRELLESYNLFGCKSQDKFVPDEYKYNSKQIRLAILAGLLNTGGSVHVKDRSSISFCSVSKRLTDDVAFLARSLGLWCYTEIKDDTRRITCYSCSLKVSNELYLMLSSKHKKRLNLETSKSKDYRMIKSIELVGKKECQCIYVDNEEHLYLTDDFIVTHNTVTMSLAFILWSMSNFNGMNFAITGKSSGAVRRNIISSLKQMLLSLGYGFVDHRADNYLEITKGDVMNLYYIFGGKDIDLSCI